MFQRVFVGRDNFKSFPCTMLKLVLHVDNNQFSVKFNNGRFIAQKWPIYHNIQGQQLSTVHLFDNVYTPSENPVVMEPPRN